MKPCFVVDIIKYIGDMERRTVDIMNIFIFAEMFVTAIILYVALRTEQTVSGRSYDSMVVTMTEICI